MYRWMFETTMTEVSPTDWNNSYLEGEEPAAFQQDLYCKLTLSTCHENS